MPPVQPFTFSGTVYDIDGTTVLSGVTVTAYNEDKDYKISGTTNSSGNYFIDVSKQSNPYTIGDDITLEAKIGNKIVQYRTSITAEGTEDKDLTLTHLDPIGLVLDLLTDNWRKGNTDNITPTIASIYHQKELNYAENDYVLCYLTNENLGPFGMGGSRFEHLGMVSVDIRTTFKVSDVPAVRAHTEKMKEEVFRIIKANISPTGNYGRVLLRGHRDFSDRNTGLGRKVIEVAPDRWGA